MAAGLKKTAMFLEVRASNIPAIRLYESEYEMTDDIAERDALTEITENASKLIVVDAPNVAQKADFYSPAR